MSEKTCERCKYSEKVNKSLFCMGQKGMPFVLPKDTCDGWRSVKPTNADKIRQMTDEELAQHLFDVVNYACPPGKEFTTVFCGKYPDCKKCWLDWLKQEVDGDA